MRFRPPHITRRPLLVAAKHDPDAFADFFDAYAPKVLSFLARRVLSPEVAMELQAETFAVALERRHQFRGTTAEEEQAWLFTVARSQLQRHWQRVASERDTAHRLSFRRELSPADFDRVETLADLRALGPQLESALCRLPPPQREAIELRVIEESAYDEIAVRLGITPEVARARVSRGLRVMAEYLRRDLSPPTISGQAA